MTKYFWNIYKMFYDPPGTPLEKRCVNCRYAAAGAGATVGLIASYGTAKTMPANVFKGMTCAFIVMIGFGSSLIALRMASIDKKWNETRYVELQAETKARRAEHREMMQRERQQQQQQQQQVA